MGNWARISYGSSGRSAYVACALTHDHIEVTDRDSVRTALARVRPQVVVNCTAFHRVDECEDRPEEAMRTNGIVAWGG